MSDHVAADEVAALGKALAGEEPSAPIEERYPEAPPEVLDTIEYVEETLDTIEERLAEKERKKAARKRKVAELVENIEKLEAKIDRVTERNGVQA